LPHLSSASSLEGFPTRGEIAQQYAIRSERELSGLDFYLTLAYWKVAIILEGVYSRHLSGALGGERENLGDLIDAADRLIAAAEDSARRLGYEQ
jgi:aminoglycoside phosphotransferase (APT) family kinase protein